MRPGIAVAAIVAVSITSIPASAARPTTATSPSPVVLDWTRKLDQDALAAHAVALGPASGSVTAIARDTREGDVLVLKRWSEDGQLIWRRVWDGPRGVKSLMLHAVATDRETGAIVVAGNLNCRLTKTHLGPMFLRKYRPSGKAVWTTLDGRCPTPENTRRPPASEVAGLDYSGERIVVGLNYRLRTDTAPRRDGVVATYSHKGALLWRHDIEFARLPDHNDHVHDVTLTSQGVVAVGRVDTEAADTWPTDVEAWVVALDGTQGEVVWRRMTTDRGPGDYDANSSVSWARGTLHIAGTRNATLSSDDTGTAVVERWRPTGRSVWRRQLPDRTWDPLVVTLRSREVVVGGTVGYPYGLDILLRRLTRTGDRVWSHRWDVDGTSLALGDLDARATRGVGVGSRWLDDSDLPSRLRLWSWSW
jgi:hypothetical protein